MDELSIVALLGFLTEKAVFRGPQRRATESFINQKLMTSELHEIAGAKPQQSQCKNARDKNYSMFRDSNYLARFFAGPVRWFRNFSRHRESFENLICTLN